MTYLVGAPPEGFTTDHFNHLISPSSIERDDRGNIVIKGYIRSRTQLITDGFDAPEQTIRIKVRSGMTSEKLNAELSNRGIPPLVFDKLPFRWT